MTIEQQVKLIQEMVRCVENGGYAFDVLEDRSKNWVDLINPKNWSECNDD